MVRKLGPRTIVARPQHVVSGGQTGVDRAALDVAIELNIPHAGFCPRGRRAEDGRIPTLYRLTETESAQYHVRTEQNVLVAQATLIFCRGPLSGGTKLTQRMAAQHRRPCLVIDLNSPPRAVQIAAWLAEHGQGTLNIAGPRESQCPGIEQEARELLLALWTTTGGGAT